MSETGAARAVVIKKYANRRLYNTATSSYVTLDNLAAMVKDGVEFVVTDARTGEDITRPVLTQIIVEEESKGQHLLPISFLRQLIGFYGNNMQWMLPGYLDYSMRAFQRNQVQMQEYLKASMGGMGTMGTMGGMFPFPGLEQMSKQNMALFENAMRMFAPFAGPADGAAAAPPPPAPPQPAPPPAAVEETPPPPADPGLDELKIRLDQLQRQMESLLALRPAALPAPELETAPEGEGPETGAEPPARPARASRRG